MTADIMIKCVQFKYESTIKDRSAWTIVSMFTYFTILYNRHRKLKSNNANKIWCIRVAVHYVHLQDLTIHASKSVDPIQELCDADETKMNFSF